MINNVVSFQIWKDRYSKGEDSPEKTIERVAKYVASNKSEYESFKRIMMEKRFLPAGRTLSNAGIGENLTLNNCFNLNHVEDSIDEIFEKVKYGALTQKAGGGTGYDFSKIRPKGSPTSNDAIASGVVSFIEAFDSQTKTILQGGRRGANMGVLNIYHPDIYDFIEAKSYEAGKLVHFNLSVMVDDDFMKAVEKDEEIYLHYPVYNEISEIEKDEARWKYKKKVRARELWDLIIKRAYDTGEPGILFYDNMNRDNNLYYLENIISTNPCVIGDTLILTDKGYFPIKDLLGKKVNVWNGEEWSDVEPRITGENQEILDIEFSDGSKLSCTPYHKFYIQNGFKEDGNQIQVEAKDLKLGDKIIKFEYPIVEFENELEEKIAYTMGFFSGDGDISNKERPIIILYDKKIELIDYLDYKKSLPQSNNKVVLVLDSDNYKDKKFIPKNYSIKTRLSWLAGLIDSNGTRNSEEGSIVITSIDKGFLMDTKLMLNTLGIHASVEDLKESAEKECYKLLISAYYVKKLVDLGLKTYRVDLSNVKPDKNAGIYITVKSISKRERLEDYVYCFTEYKRHMGVFNGILTGQCSEFVSGVIFDEELKSDGKDYWGACNLGSIFLHNHVKNPFTKNAEVDWGKLFDTINTAVRILDNIIDINKYPLLQYENYQKAFRTIGLGVTGLADMLVMLNLKYGSEESMKFIDSLFEFITVSAYKISIELAREKGSFPALDKEKFIESNFIQKHYNNFTSMYHVDWNSIIDGIRKYGIRNARLISIAPTGTLSLSFGENCSSGIEPIFSLSYKRKVKVGGQEEENIQIVDVEDYAYKLYRELKNQGIEGLLENPPFVTALELSVKEHLDVLRTMAYHVDMNISKTINIPESYSFEETKDVYYIAWKSGIKGCTIFRPNPLREGILITDEKKEEKPSTPKDDVGLKRGDWEELPDDIIYYKRKIYIGCGKINLFIGYSHYQQKICDMYVVRSGNGGCEKNLQGMVIAMSGMLRLGGSLYNIEKAFEGLGSCNSFVAQRVKGQKLSQGGSCGTAILNDIKKFLEEVNKAQSIPDIAVMKEELETKDFFSNEEKDFLVKFGEIAFTMKYHKCPVCGEKINQQEGCYTCVNCGWTKCS